MPSRMTGIKEYRAALRAAPDELRAEVLAAITASVTATHAAGLANIDAMGVVDEGTLRRWYRKRISAKALTGKVGFLGKRARQRVFYARFVHDGTRYVAARPFHRNAVNATIEAHRRLMTEARDRVIRQTLGAGNRPAISRFAP